MMRLRKAAGKKLLNQPQGGDDFKEARIPTAFFNFYRKQIIKSSMEVRVWLKH